MADDKIDIEEHEILDNPVIRRMFPDIAMLKKEIIYFHDEVLIKETAAKDIVQQETKKCAAVALEEANLFLSYLSSKPSHAFCDAKFIEGTQTDEAEKYSTIVIDEDSVTLPCLSEEPAVQVLEENISDSICTQIDGGDKYQTIVINKANETSSCLLSKLVDKVIETQLIENNLNQKINKTKFPTIVIDEANENSSYISKKLADKVLEAQQAENNLKQTNETEKYPIIVIDEGNVTLPCFSNDPTDPVLGEKLPEIIHKQIDRGEKYPTIVIDETDETSCILSKLADKVIEAQNTENNLKKITETEKYITIVIDKANVTLPYFSSKAGDQFSGSKFTKKNCTTIDKAEKYPTIVADESNVTLSCFFSKLVDQVIDPKISKKNYTQINEDIITFPSVLSESAKRKLGAKFVENNFIQTKEAEKCPTIGMDEALTQSLPCFPEEPTPCTVLGSKLTKRTCTRIDKAEKYPTIVADESNVTSSCFFSKLREQVIGPKLSKNNQTQINEDIITFESVSSESAARKLRDKSVENYYTQINEAEKYQTKVIDKSNVILPCDSIEADEIHKNYNNTFDSRMNIKKYGITRKTRKDPVIIEEDTVETKRVSESYHINDNEGNKINVILNNSKLPNSLQKTIGLPKQKGMHSLNPDRNSPQFSKLGGKRIPLAVTSSSKSNSNCADNFQLEQDMWIGNKIILGSKSSTIDFQNKVCRKQNISSNVRVLVENIGTFLSKSSRYCKTCFILFPSNKTLADHRNLIHPQLNNKQLDKSNDIIKKSVNFENKHKCNVCGTLISSASNLLRHKRRVHSLYIKQNKRRIRSIQSQPNTKLREETKFRCTHCNKIFASQQVLIDHMYNVLQSETNKDAIKSIDDVNLEREDKHKKSRVFYRCPFCSYYFMQKNNYDKHLKIKHKKTDKKILQKVVFDPVCKFCSRNYCNVPSFNVHISKHHQNQLKMSRHIPKIKDDNARKIFKR